MVKLKISLNGIVILPSLLMGIRARDEGVETDLRMPERYVQAVQYENAVGRSERSASFEHKPGSEYDRLESIAEWKRWCTDEIAAAEKLWKFEQFEYMRKHLRDEDFLCVACGGAFLEHCQSITRGIVRAAPTLTVEDINQIIPEISGCQGIADIIVSFVPEAKVLEIPVYNEMVTWITKLIEHAYYFSRVSPKQLDKNWRVTRVRAALNTSFRAISGDSCHPRHHIRIQPYEFDSVDRIDPDARHSIVCIEVPFSNETKRRYDWWTLVCDVEAV